MHYYHSLVPSHEKRIDRQLEKFKSHAYTHCRTKYLNFSVGTRIANKSRAEKKLHNSDVYIIPAIAEIIKGGIL